MLDGAGMLVLVRSDSPDISATRRHDGLHAYVRRQCLRPKTAITTRYSPFVRKDYFATTITTPFDHDATFHQQRHHRHGSQWQGKLCAKV